MAKICIDAGHGGNDVGASKGGRYERDDVLKMALAVAEKLRASGVEVVLTRSDNSDIGINARTELANREKCGYFLSIHRNACNGSASGNEIWIYSKSGDDNAAKAKSILDAVCAADKLTNRGVHKGAPNYTDFGVNRLTSMPAALLELGFIDNDYDNACFDGCFDLIAEGIARALCGIVGAEYSAGESIGRAEKAPQDNQQDKPRRNLVLEWQMAAVADGYRFPKYGADGKWGSECESVARVAVVKKRLTYQNRSLTKLVQSMLGVTADGLCGKNTDAAIRRWQATVGLAADGAIGINSWKKLLGV